MSTKVKKTASWVQCDKCEANITNRDLEIHQKNCPPNTEQFTHSFILNGNLHSSLEIKQNEDIKGLEYHEKNNLLFLSQSVIQLCGFVIGDWCILSSNNCSVAPCCRIIWPTNEKSLVSALVTKSGYDLNWRNRQDIKITVKKLDTSKLKRAQQITLIAQNTPKTLQFTSELNLRIKKLHLNRFVTEGNKLSCIFYGKQLEFVIKAVAGEASLEQSLATVATLSITEDPVFHQITNETSFKLYGHENDLQPIKQINPLSEISGYDQQIEEISDLIDICFGRIPGIPELKISNGLLLYGPSGTGKTLIAEGVTQLSHPVTLIHINGPELFAKYSGNIEETIIQKFNEALLHPPSIIILDELDVLCPARSAKLTEQEKRITSTVLVQLDRLDRKRVFVIACSNQLENIDASFRRSGRLDREIEIPIPTPEIRHRILKKLLNKCGAEITPEETRELSNECHGFTGSDLSVLVNRAGLAAIKRSSMTSLDSANIQILCSDVRFALTKVQPSAMKQIQIEVPTIKWSDIGGQEKLKLILKQCVEWPIKYADSFTRLGISPPRGVLMYGPPGCSKTMIAKALATESNLNFLSIKGPELFSKYVGESERAVRELFRKARQVAPSIVFFDEIDAIGGERSGGTLSGGASVQERVLAQLLTELDGITPLKDVTILAATNRPDRIDRALIRPGRLDRIVYVPLPDADTRRQIFQIKMTKIPTSDVDIEWLVAQTQNYSGAEINAVCHEAAMSSLEENIQAKFVTHAHFVKALGIVKPRTTVSLLKVYEDYVKEHELLK